MNLLSFVTAQDIAAQLEREKKNATSAIQLAEQVADWRMRIRLWNLVHQRYVLAARNNNWNQARRLYFVLIETRMVVAS